MYKNTIVYCSSIFIQCELMRDLLTSCYFRYIMLVTFYPIVCTYYIMSHSMTVAINDTGQYILS